MKQNMPTQQTFINAATDLKLLKLIDYDGNHRIVEPYMIYDSAKGKFCYHVFQLDGFSDSGKAIGWKNPEVESFEFSEIIETSFRQRNEYNPFNEKMFVTVHFAIPTIDGRKRTI